MLLGKIINESWDILSGDVLPERKSERRNVDRLGVINSGQAATAAVQVIAMRVPVTLSAATFGGRYLPDRFPRHAPSSGVPEQEVAEVGNETASPAAELLPRHIARLESAIPLRLPKTSSLSEPEILINHGADKLRNSVNYDECQTSAAGGNARSEHSMGGLITPRSDRTADNGRRNEKRVQIAKETSVTDNATKRTARFSLPDLKGKRKTHAQPLFNGPTMPGN